ncbi:Cytidine and deoxycytidylate deaminase zinc-binding region [compost metagenome]
MDMAIRLAAMSKCVSMQVGVVAVNERGRVIATGVNGTVSGSVNCCEVHQERGPEHSAWSEEHEIHGEMNTILEMARSTVTFNEVTFYTTHCPCNNCLKHMLGLNSPDTKVKRIIYNEVYYRTPAGQLPKQEASCKRLNVELLSIQEIVANELQPQIA